MSFKLSPECNLLCVARSALLAICLLFSLVPAARAQERTEIVGDYLQYILPATGAVCSFGRSVFRDYAVRFLIMEGLVHGTKNVFPDAAISVRPHGGDKGFPSGHSAASFYGASYLARECVNKSPWGQAVVFGAAMFTGGSRIEAGAHFLFQVMYGALIGYFCDRLFRRKGVERGPERWHTWRAKWAERASRRSV
jgi:membrane-associated phospholipid phosphatase